MIITEKVIFGTTPFIHTYSDAGLRIRQIDTGYIYMNAYDLERMPREYEEVEEPEEEQEAEEEEAKETAEEK